MKSLFHIVIAVCWLLPVLNVRASDTTDTAALESWVLKTPSDVLNAIVRYIPELGDAASLTESDISLFTENANQVPFVHRSIDGRTLWKAEVLLTLRLTNYLPLDSSDTRKRTFAFVLDPLTGALISASCVRSTNYPDRKPPLSVEESDAAFSRMRERIESIATEVPVVSLFQALDVAWGNPYGAMEIYAWHVNYTKFDHAVNDFEPVHPVWWLDLRGFPPIDHEKPAITYLRSLVDSRSGQLIRTTNLGQ